MADSPGQRQSPKPSPQPSERNVQASPARSDRSSDSEGRPVRQKLKDTRIDAQTSPDTSRPSDQPMRDAPNGAEHAMARDHSASSSDGGRGRVLRRKRSYEDVGEEEETKSSGKRHLRKKSRDVTSPAPAGIEVPGRIGKSSVTPIDEHDGDEKMATTEAASANGQSTPSAGTSDKEGTRVSPRNKRTHDQTTSTEATDVSKDIQEAGKAQEEPNAKRPREKSDLQAPDEAEGSKTKIPPSSGFANFSASSPFSALSKPPKSTTTAEKTPEDLPQTSEDKFKSSGFGSFASSSASPFGAIGGSTPKSPFAAATGGSKLSSFAAPSITSTSTTGGFAALSGSTQSGFGAASAKPTGGPVFGGSLGQSAFGVLNPPKGGLSSFGNAGSSTISGLKTTTRAFGAAADEEEDESGDEGEVDHDNSGEAPDKEDAEKSKQSEQKKQINLVPREGKFTRARLLGSTDLVVVETGEENEESIWVGRGRLFIFQEKGWKECGVGPLKFNISKDKPKRARFILRNDGTNKVVLNAGIRKELKVGDEQGEKPADGKLFFMVPTADKSIKKHVIRMKPEKAVELYEAVQRVQKEELQKEEL